MTPLMLSALAALAAWWVPRHLVAASWAYRAPQLGALAWLALGYGILVAVALAGVTVVVHWDATHDLLCTTWEVCFDALRGQHGRPAQSASIAGLGLLGWLTARLVAGTWLIAIADGLRHRRHLTLVDIVGKPSSGLAATVVPCASPAAYVIPGRRPRIVITTGALAVLSAEETAAVLAHERAHATGGHHRIVGAAALLYRAFGLALFELIRRQVGRLLEMRADDVAVQRHSRLVLASALVAMADPPPAPSAALNAGGPEAIERVQRLLDPPAPLPGATRAFLAIGLVLLATSPMLLALVDRALG
jgi:Zn-dependent protease with chaperone function